MAVGVASRSAGRSPKNCSSSRSVRSTSALRTSLGVCISLSAETSAAIPSRRMNSSCASGQLRSIPDAAYNAFARSSTEAWEEIRRRSEVSAPSESRCSCNSRWFCTALPITHAAAVCMAGRSLMRCASTVGYSLIALRSLALSMSETSSCRLCSPCSRSSSVTVSFAASSSASRINLTWSGISAAVTSDSVRSRSLITGSSSTLLYFGCGSAAG
mmetsp:Transcript_27970/g.69486  ORF Transcript_27970/g.69486 Transcript_27970/m.69486 type:complete len:215 (+) Transcript_27970:591-1235(+)